MSRPKALARKRLAASASCLAESRKSRVAAARSHGPERITPLALNADVRLVHAPEVVDAFEPFAHALLQFGGVTLYPPP